MSKTSTLGKLQIYNNMNQLVLLFVHLTAIQLSHQKTLDCKNVSYNTHIQNVTFFRTKIEALPPTARLNLEYTIAFSAEKCCPVVGFETENTLESNSHRDPTLQCYQKEFQNLALTSQYYIYLSEWNRNSGCMRKGSYYVCSGTRKFYVGTEVHWWIDFGYECRIQQQLDISIEMKFTCNVQEKCENIKSNYCRKTLKYTQTFFPNTLGQQSQKWANNLIGVILLVIRKHPACYKYIREVMCYSLFPLCVRGKAIIPCKQTCIEAIIACEYILRLYKQPIYCGTYPSSLDPEVCFYKPVMCPKEEDPEFGKVMKWGRRPFNITEVVCNPGYQIVGDGIRHCLYSGFLNGTKPRCVLKSGSNDINSPTNVAIIVGLLASCSIIILLVITLMYHRKNIVLFFLHSRLITQRLNQIPQEQSTLFVTYSSDDREKIQNGLVPQIKLELPTWNVTTYQENFIGGDKLLEAIHKGIWESAAVIAIVTPNYVRSEWCKYEFQEAQTHSASNKEFKLIIVLFEENDITSIQNSLWNEVPESIKTWIMGRVYLTVGEQLFWNKLRRALARRHKR